MYILQNLNGISYSIVLIMQFTLLYIIHINETSHIFKVKVSYIFSSFLFNKIKNCAEFKVSNASVRRAGKGNGVQRATGNAGEGRRDRAGASPRTREIAVASARSLGRP